MARALLLKPNISSLYPFPMIPGNIPLTRCCAGNTNNIIAKILKNNFTFIPPINYSFVANSKIVFTSLIASSTLSISFFAIERLTESIILLIHFDINSGEKFL